MSQTLNILIVDDEAAARQKIKGYFREGKFNVYLQEARDGKEAVLNIKKHTIDLVLLDIQMPGMNGFEVIRAIGTHQMPPVVFITAYDQYAIEAFKVKAVDYLLKPFDFDRFKEAFQRAVEQIKMKANFSNLFDQLLQKVNTPKAYLERILVNIGSRHFFLSLSEIHYISSDDKYIELHTKEKKYLIRETLSKLEQELDPGKFVRIHRSHLINLDYIQEMHPKSHGDYTVVMKNGDRLTISRRYRDRVFGK